MTAIDPLERALVDLGGAIAYPSTPDIARAVRHRIESGAGAERRAARIGRRRLWSSVPRVAWVAAALAALFAGALVFSPSTRQAVADFFGVDGIRIHVGGRAPEGLGADLDLGERISLADAQSRVTFPIQVPSIDRLGAPDEVYFGAPPPGGQLSFVYAAGPGLPAAPPTDVGLLFSQFSADLEGAFFKKAVQFGTNVRFVLVNGADGYWVHGAPHVFSYRDVEGHIVEESSRLAGDVLVWSRDGVTYRIESGLRLREVLEIAESLEPISD